MSIVADRGLASLRQRFAEGKETLSDFEIECEFWLLVEQCEFCSNYGDQLCSIHYDRMVMTL